MTVKRDRPLRNLSRRAFTAAALGGAAGCIRAICDPGSQIAGESTLLRVVPSPFAPLSVEAQAANAIAGYMRLAPEPMGPPGRHYRAVFRSWFFPPTLGHDRWDWGDCTSRAVLAWFNLREMTGDEQTGRRVEEGQRALLLALLHPETGLAFQPDSNGQAPAGPMLYHVWDQSRALRALVRWFEALPQDRQRIGPFIERMIRGIGSLATQRGSDPHWGAWRGLPSDEFRDRRPGPRVGWVNMRAGLLIEPLVAYAELASHREALDLAVEFANCALGGHEGDGLDNAEPRRLELTWVDARRDFEFAPDGAFTGHFHTKSSTLVGIAKLGRHLLAHGGRERGLVYLRRVREVYDWIFATSNENRGSRIGWFPEQLFPGRVREVCETCCLTDMIDLAAALASCSVLHSELASWADLYDDVEAMTVNTLARSQVHAATLERLIVALPAASQRKARAIAARLGGVWAAKFYPDDLLFTEHDGTVQALAWGCCAYAGFSGLYSGWRECLQLSRGRLIVNYLLTVHRPFAHMRSTLPLAPEAALTIRHAAEVLVRAPAGTPVESLRAWRLHDGARRDAIEPRPCPGSRYVSLGWLDRGTSVALQGSLPERVTRERIGGANRGGNLLDAGYSRPAEKTRYEITWRGNYVRRIDPPGRRVRLFPPA